MSMENYIWLRTIAEVVAIAVGFPLFVVICIFAYVDNKRRRQAIKDICDGIRKRGPKLHIL